jgi:hypothetical protein
MRRALRAALAGADDPVLGIAPSDRSTDMTSVPGPRPAPPLPRWHAWPAVRSFRPPTSAGGRAIALVATALGFGASLLVMRNLSTPTARERPVVATMAAPIDPTRASVAIGEITTTGGISSSTVRTALARVPFTLCYRKALANRSTANPMEASLRITIDSSGRVTGATLSSDGGLSALRSCIESEARGMSIRDVDTGDGSAVITLGFSPR